MILVFVLNKFYFFLKNREEKYETGTVKQLKGLPQKGFFK